MANFTQEDTVGAILISNLPDDIQALIQKMNLDKDGDGTINAAEMSMVLNDYRGTKKDNKNLRYSVVGLVVGCILLIGCVFGASITAARLSKDTSVDPVSGVMYSKGVETTVKTEPVEIRENGVTIVDLTDKELKVLKHVILDGGSIEFAVRGYARVVENNQVALIVDGGGTLLYGEEGLVNATGVADTVLTLAAYSERMSNDKTVSTESKSQEQ